MTPEQLARIEHDLRDGIGDAELDLAVSALVREYRAATKERDAWMKEAASAWRAGLEEAEAERDHYAKQLGLVYWHVSGGELSKPYDFKDVESRIDEHLNEFYGKEAREAEQALAAMTAERDEYERKFVFAEARRKTAIQEANAAEQENARLRAVLEAVRGAWSTSEERQASLDRIDAALASAVEP